MPEELQQIQQAFSAYIRNPKRSPLPPGVDKARMDMYRELFFNNIDGFLSGGFPVLKRILSDAEWQALTEDFFAHHTCSTPFFSEIAEEFLTYLQSEPPLIASYPPFLTELAHYEWVEMALSIAQEHTPELDSELTADPGDYPLALSPLAWPLAYRFPVQRLSPEYRPHTPPEQPTYLVVFRDAGYDVRFLEISAPTFALLQLIQDHPGLDARRYLQELSSADKNDSSTALYQSILQIVRNLAELGIIYRDRKPCQTDRFIK